jgi:hypothetical protein
MAEKATKEKVISEAPSRKDGCSLLVTCDECPKKERIVCDVCGYANPAHTALCKMCSNYLNLNERKA